MNYYKKKLLRAIALKIPSFTQLKNKFFEHHNDFVKLIEVQFLDLGNGEISFNISFGVHIPAIHLVIWGRSDSLKKLVPGDCVFECNLDDILRDFKGSSKVRYWRIGTDKDEVYEEVTDLIQCNLLPFSERFKTLEDVNKLTSTIDFPLKYLAARPVMIVALKAIIKEREEMREFVQELERRQYYGLPLVNKIVKLTSTESRIPD